MNQKATMPIANGAAGPGRPIVERKDAVDAQEQTDDLDRVPDPTALPPVPRAGTGSTPARQAGRNAAAGGDREEDERRRGEQRGGGRTP
jgi:hypothetical protein